MKIDERRIALASEDDVARASEVGWFAARQPGLMRYLEDRLGRDPDGLAIALELCWRVVAAFEMQLNLPLPRLLAGELELAEEEAVRESQGELRLANGCAHRQPDLCDWLAGAIQNPALPLSAESLDVVALAVAATISTCDRAQLSVLSLHASKAVADDTLLR